MNPKLLEFLPIDSTDSVLELALYQLIRDDFMHLFSTLYLVY